MIHLFAKQSGVLKTLEKHFGNLPFGFELLMTGGCRTVPTFRKFTHNEKFLFQTAEDDMGRWFLKMFETTIFMDHDWFIICNFYIKKVAI